MCVTVTLLDLQPSIFIAVLFVCKLFVVVAVAVAVVVLDEGREG